MLAENFLRGKVKRSVHVVNDAYGMNDVLGGKVMLLP